MSFCVRCWLFCTDGEKTPLSAGPANTSSIQPWAVLQAWSGSGALYGLTDWYHGLPDHSRGRREGCRMSSPPSRWWRTAGPPRPAASGTRQIQSPQTQTVGIYIVKSVDVSFLPHLCGFEDPEVADPGSDARPAAPLQADRGHPHAGRHREEGCSIVVQVRAVAQCSGVPWLWGLPAVSVTRCQGRTSSCTRADTTQG